MTRFVFDHVEPMPDFAQLPVTFTLTTSRSSAVVKLLMLAPMMVILAVPLTLIGAHAQHPALSLMLGNPIAALQILTGLIVWVALFIWPLKRIVGCMGARREVSIDGGKVAVSDSSPFGDASWSAPLATYRGIAHHIRASLSGNRHELVLVHADPAKNVVLSISDRISQTTFERAKSLLNLPEVPAKDLYARA